MPSDALQRPAQAPVQQPRQNIMDKDVSVSLNIRTVASWLAVLLLMSASFLAGRYVFPSDGGISLGTSGAAAVVDTESAQEAAETEPATAGETEPAGSSGSSESADTTKPTETSNSSETAPTESTPTIATVTTTYTDVKLSFTKVPDFKWYEEDGYGKITTIWYTIVNDEDGIIKPVKFRIKVEGYDSDNDVKFVEVPGVDREINPGETVSHGVDKGVSYRPEVTDPTNINIQLELLDESNAVIATVSQEFNLKS